MPSYVRAGIRKCARFRTLSREVIGVAEGMKEDGASWEQFVRSMIERGLRGVRLVVGDRCAGLVSTVGSMLPNAKYQRCMVHFMRNVLSKVPPGHRDWASAALKAIFAMESRESALAKAGEVAEEMESRKLKAAVDCLREGIEETTVYLAGRIPERAPQEDPHEQHDRTAEQGDPTPHPRRGQLPDGNSVLMLICARIRYVNRQRMEHPTLLDMSRFDDNLQVAS